jgi:hypothetical protein
LWPPIAHGDTKRLRWGDFKRVKVLAWAAVSALPILLVFTIATFPGEWLEEQLYGNTLLGPDWMRGEGSVWSLPHDFLVAGYVNFVTDRPTNLWSNVLVLPDFKAGDQVKSDPGGTIAIGSDALSLRARDLRGAVFVRAHLEKADLSFSQLPGANLVGAQLQGANLANAQLPGADLQEAQLQGAFLAEAQLQGADLSRAKLQGADLDHVFVWRTGAPKQPMMSGALVASPEPRAKYREFGCSGGPEGCNWTVKSYAALKSMVENSLPAGAGPPDPRCVLTR